MLKCNTQESVRKLQLNMDALLTIQQKSGPNVDICSSPNENI
jgi:hypothetical protein